MNELGVRGELLVGPAQPTGARVAMECLVGGLGAEEARRPKAPAQAARWAANPNARTPAAAACSPPRRSRRAGRRARPGGCRLSRKCRRAPQARTAPRRRTK